MDGDGITRCYVDQSRWDVRYLAGKTRSSVLDRFDRSRSVIQVEMSDCEEKRGFLVVELTCEMGVISNHTVVGETSFG